jgi:glycosidase
MFHKLHPDFEFHISRKTRAAYQFNESLFATNGNVIFANFHAARQFAQKINSKRDLLNYPEKAVRAGQINAMGLIDEIYHIVLQLYRQQINPSVMQEAIEWINAMMGEDVLDQVLLVFINEFPPTSVFRGEVEKETYLDGKSNNVSHRQLLLEELIMLWLANKNPALNPFYDLFDDEVLVKSTAYTKIQPLLHAFFETQPVFGPENKNIMDMLQCPMIASPHSLSGQLDYIRKNWSGLLGKYIFQLLSSMDLIREEEKISIGFGGPGPAQIYTFAGQEEEVDAFSPDQDWMPKLVMIAKNVYVWLDQLSRKYQRSITRLDQIPDEILDQLSTWGFSGLWLIGLWERSTASRTIKQLRGNPDAVASAYSLYDYQIAHELGGEKAYHELRDRAWQRGIRLSSDMVPNHMGIDSRWMIEHPDWFIGLDYSPFPSYSFNGPNLSRDDRVEIFIEDHYYDNTDAAVVFKHYDRWRGQTRFIYHGNDGTSMPWNDTAQLNYLLPEVREAVIQTILSVARKFSIIRFDAAMTLAKKHFQRLWFPQPGSGGDIPSRAEFALTKEQFNEAMPLEFWREVVDRVAQEVPDTLLLAEAFWLMEGYFVRTLGMHRVYNSAFMNMLRDEKNAEYRLVIKNTVEFDPEILKRYVNFMNNPDERTAVDQFGKGDKYFGICILLATMPGLPMFGHGQIEGFTEKYGMEYHHAYWDEPIDSYLVNRHIKEVFPLLKRRSIFAEVSNFLLYDLYTSDGFVNEDVFAYSNRSGNQRSLVLYNNRYSSARGWIKQSAAYAIKDDHGERSLVQKTLAEGLLLDSDPSTFVIFRDFINGLQYIRRSQEMHEKGLYVELDAYKAKVFVDFEQIKDNEWRQYAQLHDYLQGNGVPNIQEALHEIFLQPIHHAFRELVNTGMLNWLYSNQVVLEPAEQLQTTAAIEEAEIKLNKLVTEIQRAIQSNENNSGKLQDIVKGLEAAMHLPVLDHLYPEFTKQDYQSMMSYLAQAPGFHELQKDHPKKDNILSKQNWAALLSWLFTRDLGSLDKPEYSQDISRSWIDEWLFGKNIANVLVDFGIPEQNAWRMISLIRLLITHHTWWKELESSHLKQPISAVALSQMLQTWLKDADVQHFIGINRYQDRLWFNKEAFEEFCWWLFITAAIDIIAKEDFLKPDKAEADQSALMDSLLSCFNAVLIVLQAEKRSGYQVDRLLKELIS